MRYHEASFFRLLESPRRQRFGDFLRPMLQKKLSASLISLALCSIATAAGAVSLGDLTVQSRPGEPLDAVLEIDELDLKVSPLLVRVAPPATYLREGVAWPAQVQDLKMVLDSRDSTVRLRIFGQEEMKGAAFPLLIEMNAGGAVTVRQYQISEADGRLEARPVSTKMTVAAPKQAQPEEIAVPKPEARDTAPKAAQSKAAQPKVRHGRFAPNVVRDYVALNGFDASAPFRIERDMTLWSVAGLYWPSYRGATMEQLLIAFRNKNPNAFEKGDPNCLLTGVKLNPPSTEEVFAVDPVAAFRELRGPDAVIPPSTQNLIDAQCLSRDAASAVADAQDRARSAGGSADAIAGSGRTALDELALKEAPQKADPASVTEDVRPASEEEEKTAEAAPQPEGAQPAAASDEAKPAEEKPDAATGVSDVKPAEPADAAVKTAETAATAAPSEAKDAPKSAEPAPAAPAAEGGEADGKRGMGFWGILGGLFLLIAGFFFLRRRKDEKEPEAQKPAPVTVQIQKNVPPSSEAQLAAVRTTVDEAVKNGTTGGAMGVGAAAYAAARMAESRDEPDAARPETEEKPAIPENQPWLQPDDESDEAEPPRPVTQEEAAAEAVRTEAALESVSLDFEDEPAQPAEIPPAPAPQPAVTPESEAPQPVISEKEQRLFEALDAKLKLASSFVGLGALDEALELLDEVLRRGSPEQRERAKFLSDRIKSRQAEVPHR